VKEQQQSTMSDLRYHNLNEIGEIGATIGFVTSASVSVIEGVIVQDWDSASRFAAATVLFLIAKALAQENQAQLQKHDNDLL
jgi:hypothetical protein